MFAKQILWSASLVVSIGGVAQAQPAMTAPVDPPPSEASPKPPSGSFHLGAGYTTDDGLIIGAGVEQANLFGTGRLLALDASLSARRERFEVRYSDPLSLPGGFLLDAGLYRDVRRLPGFNRGAVGTALTISHALGPNVTGYLTYRIEHVTAEPEAALLAYSTIDPPPPPFTQSGTISSLRAGLVYNTLDSKIAPRRGTSVGTWIEVASPELGSDYTIATTHAWASTHQPLGPLTMHLGGSFTTVSSPDPAGVPMTEKLYLDGSSELRGYSPDSFAGGNMKLLGRAELEAPLVRRVGLSAHAFYEAAGIFTRDRVGEIGWSWGAGLLWRSPVGPISVDVAWPLGQGPPQWIFNVGTGF